MGAITDYLIWRNTMTQLTDEDLEKRREYHRAYRAKNPERMKLYGEMRRATKKDELKAYNKEYQQKNKEKIAIRKFKKAALEAIREEGLNMRTRNPKNFDKIICAVQDHGWEIQNSALNMHTGGFLCELKIFFPFPEEIVEKNREEKAKRKQLTF